MSPLLIQPIRPVKPVSFAQSMHKAKEGDRSQDWMSQLAASRPAVVAEQAAPQAEPFEHAVAAVFPRFSTLALVQMMPARSASPARVQDYAAMASSNDDDADLGLGQLFDLHA